MKIAIIHDFITKLGGAEFVLKVLHKIYPEAPIYTLLYDNEGTKGEFSGSNYKIITSKLQKLPRFLRLHNKFLLSYYPRAIEEFDLSRYDVVISSSNSFAHGVITRPETLHITYCYSPMRYAWDWGHKYLNENNIGFGIFVGLKIRKIISDLRIWDFLASRRTDQWVAISRTVAERIKKYYKKESVIIYPPVDIKPFLDNHFSPQDYYLIVSRLTPYKKIDLAIKAFNQLKIPLRIIGEGSDAKRLKKLAGANIHFSGWLRDKEKNKAFKQSKVFLFPGEDDFGITPVEAMASGRPICAYGAGGATETIIGGKTGEFFYDYDNIESLKKSVLKIENNYSSYTTENCQEQAKKFSEEIFIKKFQQFTSQAYRKHLEEYKA